MTTVFVDLESYSDVPIKYGPHRYAEGSEIIVIAYAIDDGEVQVIDMMDPADTHDLRAFQISLANADTIVAHNASFDRTLLEYHGYHSPIEKWHCTMAQAMAHSLPGKLANLCTIMKVPLAESKHAGGVDLIKLFCIGKKDVPRATRHTHPREWADFLAYAGADVLACRALKRKLPTWNYRGEHLSTWHLDQRINNRGVFVDRGLAEHALACATSEQARLRSRTEDETLGLLESTTQRAKLLKHLLACFDIDLPDLKAGTIERRLDDPDVPEPVKELLRLRLMASKTSSSKYKALLNSVCSDGFLRGLLAFCGALRSGRWAGRLFQPQNLPRTPKYLAKQMAFVIQCILDGSLEMWFDNVMEALGAATRGVLCAPEGKTLMASDLSNIEGRGLAWLAGEWWKVKAFEDFDTFIYDEWGEHVLDEKGEWKRKGEDLYVLGYAASFGVSVYTVKDDDAAGGVMRLIGKVQELALGYQGAVGAFATMGLAYGLELDKKQVGAIVGAWRRANPAIVQMWSDAEDAAVTAITSPGTTVPCGRLQMRCDGPWFRIRLPSGRFLCYPHPQYNEQRVPCRHCGGAKVLYDELGFDEPCWKCNGTGRVAQVVISYMGVHQYTRQWTRLTTYGGKLVENVTQALARDILAYNMQAVEDAGYEIVLSVHDELITQVPANDDRFSPEGLSEIMTRVPPWAEGLPLAAKGYAALRYKKG